MISSIYAIVSPSGNLYIGSAKDTEKRWNQHRSALRKGVHHSTVLQRAWEKYGEDNFRFIVVVPCQESDLFPYEQMLIDRLKPKYNVNPSACGTRGLRWSEESKARIRGRSVGKEARAKISAALTGKHPTEETRQKLIASHAGKPWTAARASHKHSPDTLAKMSASHMGHPVSEETRAKLAAQAGWKHSEEARRKMSCAKVGYVPWNKGIRKIACRLGHPLKTGKYRQDCPTCRAARKREKRNLSKVID